MRAIATRHLLTALIVIGALAAAWFGARSYGSFLLLRSAYAAGTPQLASMRPWMTLDYVEKVYRVPLADLLPHLNLPSTTARAESLKSIADRRGVPRFDFVRDVQSAAAKVLAVGPPAAPTKTEPAPDSLTDYVLAALLAYGYPALAFALLLGAIGLPIPTALAAILAGSLVALGHLNGIGVALIAVVASVSGDATGYGIGRLVGETLLVRYGRWIGYIGRRKETVEALFHHWGGLAVLVSRTLASSVSSVINILAGVTGYRLAPFLLYALIGRMVWMAAYLGLGCGIGSHLDTAGSFLANLTGLLLALAVLAIAGATRAGLFRRAAAGPR
jgi:membrane protein DedA with SNARE-associated domain